MMNPTEFVRISREAYRKCGRRPKPRTFGDHRLEPECCCVLGAHLHANGQKQNFAGRQAAVLLGQNGLWADGVIDAFDQAPVTSILNGHDYENGYACGLAARKAFLETN